MSQHFIDEKIKKCKEEEEEFAQQENGKIE
jgi:hypothetical protein